MDCLVKIKVLTVERPPAVRTYVEQNSPATTLRWGSLRLAPIILNLLYYNLFQSTIPVQSTDSKLQSEVLHQLIKE